MGYCGYCRVLEVLWGTGGYWGVLEVLWSTGGYGGTGGTVGYGGVQGYLGVNRVVVDTLGYCVVLSGYCMVLLVTAGYFWVLGGTGVH